MMGKFDDAFRIGNEIINESRFPPSAVRIRVYMAHDYLLTNQIDKAKELLDKAESIIKYEFGGVRRGRADTGLWILRGEAEFYVYKSIYFLRIGKSEDAMNMARIPETRDEVEELAKILGADPKSDLYLGANATRESVLKSSTSGQLLKKQVVVFATHGLLAGDLPNLSQPALAMAATANPADSPLLTLEDVLSLKLNADWVVLSACNTAGADGRAEEAMSGLARGFFFAGSRSLLVTHWSVESESAMQLTTNAFASYKKDTAMRRSEALRQSMLAVMKSPAFGHPAFWAPYALVGEGGR
jgi:CHAT domain-containing protein